MNTIDASVQLDAFRAAWGGRAMLDRLRALGGKMLVQWPVGVGKSHNCDAVIEEAVRSGDYDLVICLSPTWNIINERAWVRTPPTNIRVEVLRPRPQQDCGSLNETWQSYERRRLGQLGRHTLCGSCLRRSTCFWPDQYGLRLAGVQVLFATQQHLMNDPGFLTRLLEWSGASRPLTIVDEDTCVVSSFSRQVSYADLDCWVDVLESLPSGDQRHQEWLNISRILRSATVVDLRGGNWQPPFVSADWAFEVQRHGADTRGASFRFLAYDLRLFAVSPLDSRFITPAGIRFANPPYLAGDCLVYSGTLNPAILKHRLRHDFPSPFADDRFNHPGTRWYNLASSLGARKHFPRNAPQILDFFARLVSRRLHEGKRPLLVAKKCFLKLCGETMQQLLAELGHANARVVWSNHAQADMLDPGVIPLINYGMIGTNLFEHFDAAYCLTSYNVDERVLDSVLQDILGNDQRAPIVIKMTPTLPRRRQAKAAYAQHASTDIGRLAPLALIEQELDPVVQAVGRVRPYTKPREIFTFQCAEIPGQPYDREFNRLDEARAHFGLPSPREAAEQRTHDRVQEAKSRNLSQRQSAEELGLDRRTVQRHWQAAPDLPQDIQKGSCRLGDYAPTGIGGAV